jgi:hypothetical protein
MRSADDAGFTFNELLVSMCIAVTAVMGYSLSSIHLYRQQSVADHSAVAIHLAQEKMEELQGQRPVVDSDTCQSGGEQNLSAKIGTGGIFSRCWTIAPSPLATDLQQIDVRVSWRDHDPHEFKLSTLIYTGD